MQKLKLALGRESLRIRSCRCNRGNYAPYTMLRGRDSDGRRFRYRANHCRCWEMRPWREDRRACGDRVPPGAGKETDYQFNEVGSNPGGDRPTFTRSRRIFVTSSGSVITAITFMGEWQCRHSSGSTSYTWAISLAQVQRLS